MRDKGPVLGGWGSASKQETHMTGQLLRVRCQTASASPFFLQLSKIIILKSQPALEVSVNQSHFKVVVSFHGNGKVSCVTTALNVI